MLWTALSLISFTFSIVNVASQCGDTVPRTPKVNAGENNYFIDLFAGALPLPFAIDKCTSTDFVPSIYHKYTCMETNMSTWEVTKTRYTTSTCTDTPTDVPIVYLDGTMNGGLYNFQCDGDNNYARIALSLAEECPSYSDVYIGLGPCVLTQPLYTQFYCDPDTVTGYVQLFLTESPTNATTPKPFELCDSALYCKSWVMTQECTLLTTTPLAIYGYIQECKPGSTDTPETTNGAVSASFSLFSVLLSFFSFVFLL